MRYQSLTQLATIITVASASPTRIVKRGDFVNDPNGNIKLSFSDETTNIGTVSIHDVVAKLSVACSTQGQCDTNSIDLGGDFNDNGVQKPITLTLGPSGAYPSDKHDLLLQVLESSIQAIAQCSTVDTSVVDCGGGPVIGATSGSCVQTFQITQCTVPKFWGVNYQPPGEDNSAPPFIGTDLTVKEPKSGFCDTFSTIAGAISGAVGAIPGAGAAGGALSLASLACV